MSIKNFVKLAVVFTALIMGADLLFRNILGLAPVAEQRELAVVAGLVLFGLSAAFAYQALLSRFLQRLNLITFSTITLLAAIALLLMTRWLFFSNSPSFANDVQNVFLIASMWLRFQPQPHLRTQTV